MDYTNNHNRFITEMIKFVSSKDDPDLIINNILKYICQNLDSERAYIFEENSKGTFDNTYEYCAKGVSAEINNLQDLEYEGLIDTWYSQYTKYGHVMIYDLEEYKQVSESMYDVLKPQGIHTLVTGPISAQGKYIGFYGVDNPPKEKMEEIADLLDMMEFVISMMIRVRNYTSAMEDYANIDSLTMCKNRRSLNRILDNMTHTSVGVLTCDLNDLKEVNDTHGHLYGDKYICDLADSLCTVFGQDNVYRIGGDEFFAIAFDLSEADMEAKVNRVNEICSYHKVSASFGYEYREVQDIPLEQIMHIADIKMYNNKSSYHRSQIASSDDETASRSELLDNILYDAFAEASENVYIYVVDLVKHVTRFSANTVETFGLPGEYMTDGDQQWFARVHPDDQAEYLEDITKVISGKSIRHACQYRARKKDGTYIWVECKGKVINSSNGDRVFAGIISRIDDSGNYDALTGLKTRSMLYDYDFKNEKGAILLVGIDHFKRIITSFGYEVGDDVLVQMARVLEKYEKEGVKVYRLNADEFVFILPDYTNNQVDAFFNSVSNSVETVSLKNDRNIHISVSAGAIEYPRFDFSTETYIDKLEATIAYVKKTQRGIMSFYSEQIQAGEDRINLIKKELRDSIANDFKGFELFYQCWMDPMGVRIIGCEALLRWKGETVKDSYPGEFIPILEESDDIVKVGQFVMREAMNKQKYFENKYGDFVVSFNASYKQYLDKDFPTQIIQTATEIGCNPSKIVIELTESCNVQNATALADIFNALITQGFMIFLDDFGTGYASLEMFKQLPCNGVKIDHGFVRELASGNHDVDLAIIDAILSMCRRLDKRIVVEGIENDQVDAIIKEMNAGYMQGYYYSKPINLIDFEELVSKNYTSIQVV